jgi:hypothetical protein
VTFVPGYAKRRAAVIAGLASPARLWWKRTVAGRRRVSTMMR